jgi:signal transduction histidine kinase
MPIRRASIIRFLLAVLCCALVALGILWVLRSRAVRLLPKHVYRLSAGNMNEWAAYGGSWEIVNGAIHNNSDERGAKLLVGSTRWTNYTLHADLRFDGDHGDMGVIVRSNEEEEGVDAYDGYYAGLRTTDGTLVIGRADYGWMEARPVLMPGGISNTDWYRLTVTSFQCQIAAEARNLTTGQTAWIVLEEHPCVQSGRVGLRSLATGGSWSNISVEPAAVANYSAIRQHVSAISLPEFPKREADYNRIFPALPSATPDMQEPAALLEPFVEQTHIGDLLNLPRNASKEVMVRGVVTLTNPDLYIEDSTGGILVKHSSTPTLNVGDVVEVHGKVQPGFENAVIESDAIRLLWFGTPEPPISITPSQAASGAYDGRFIEIEGRLTHSQVSNDGNQILYLTDGVQTFRTINSYRRGEPQHPLEINSFLRVRGICSLSQKYTQGLTPFVVLLRSSNEIQVLAAPPWWTPLHESLLFAGVLVAVLLLQLAYFRFQRWKSETVTRERERLAHEIHDTMAQGFAGIGYQIQGIRKTVMHGNRVNLQHVSEQLGVAYQVVRSCHEEASRTIAMLSSAVPNIQKDLLGTLAEAARRICDDQIKVATHVEGNPVPLRLRTANSLMHIGQEAIANAVGHSEPTELSLTLRYDEHSVELIVKDNGQGFEYSQEKAGFGILGMQKRARDIGGLLRISSTPGSGTELRVKTSLRNITMTRWIVNLVKYRTRVRALRPHL